MEIKGFRRGWVLVTASGFVLGLLAGSCLELFLPVSQRLTYSLAVGGLGSILAQGWFLRKHNLWYRGWISASLIGLALSVAVYAAIYILSYWNAALPTGTAYVFPKMTLGVMIGLAVGTAQGLILIRHYGGAGRWVWVSLIAWIAAVGMGPAVGSLITLPLIFFTSSFSGSQPENSGMEFLMFLIIVLGIGLSMGIILGVITGSSLVRLLQINAGPGQIEGRPVIGETLRTRWISANILAFALGGLAGALIELAFFLQIREGGFIVVDGSTFPVGLLIGILLSVLFQGFVLWNSQINPARWVAASMAGLFAALGLFFVTGLLERWFSDLALFSGSSIAYSFGLIALLGLAVGAAQWVVFRQQVSPSGAWIISTVLGYIFGLVFGFVIGTSFGMALAFLLSSSVSGAVGGVIFPAMLVLGIGAGYAWLTGNLLERLLTKQSPQTVETVL